jgi:hypothetical protein
MARSEPFQQREAISCQRPLSRLEICLVYQLLRGRTQGIMVSPVNIVMLLALTNVPSRKPNGLAAYFDIAHFRSRAAEWLAAQTEEPKPVQGNALECLSARGSQFSYSNV